MVPTTAFRGDTRTLIPELMSRTAVALAVVSEMLTALIFTEKEVTVPLPLLALFAICE